MGANFKWQYFKVVMDGFWPEVNKGMSLCILKVRSAAHKLIRQNSNANEKTFGKVKICPKMSKYFGWGGIIWRSVGWFVWLRFFVLLVWVVLFFIFMGSLSLKGVLPRSHLWQTTYTSFPQNNNVPCWILTALLILILGYHLEVGQKHRRGINFASPEAE